MFLLLIVISQRFHIKGTLSRPNNKIFASLISVLYPQIPLIIQLIFKQYSFEQNRSSSLDIKYRITIDGSALHLIYFNVHVFFIYFLLVCS